MSYLVTFGDAGLGLHIQLGDITSDMDSSNNIVLVQNKSTATGDIARESIQYSVEKCTTGLFM